MSKPSQLPAIEENACFAPDPRPWWQRKVSRFFKWHGMTPDLPTWAKDGISTHISTNFCFADRIRILLTGNVNVRVLIACENPPGKVETFASVVAPLSQ